MIFTTCCRRTAVPRQTRAATVVGRRARGLLTFAVSVVAAASLCLPCTVRAQCSAGWIYYYDAAGIEGHDSCVWLSGAVVLWTSATAACRYNAVRELAAARAWGSVVSAKTGLQVARSCWSTALMAHISHPHPCSIVPRLKACAEGVGIGVSGGALVANGGRHSHGASGSRRICTKFAAAVPSNGSLLACASVLLVTLLSVP